MNDFWKEAEESGEVLFPTVQAVAVFRNQRGDISIVQQKGVLEDSDHLIEIPMQHVPALIQKLQDIHRIAMTGE